MRRTCLNMVHELAKRDPRVVFIGSDLGAGVLDEMKAEMPDRFFMEGISEQNIIGMAAGMALDGYIPYVNTIASFITRRCFEQIAIDVCLPNLPVRLIGNGGGLVYAPLGPTHLATEDIAIMRALPNMTVAVAADADEMTRLMDQTRDVPGPIYIRLAKGGDPVVSRPKDEFQIGKAIVFQEPGDVLLISTGICTDLCLKAAALLAERDISCGVVHVHTVKPLDEETLLQLARSAKLVATVEEHSVIGGLGSAVADLLMGCDAPIPRIRRFGLPDAFPEHYGSQNDLMAHYGLTVENIAAQIGASLLP